MAIYGMKDAANLILRDKVTGLPVLYVDYANATSSEWTSEQVYATKKGANAIRWDNGRTGTLTIDTELFDFSLLAMVMGSDIKEGKDNLFTRVDGTLDEDLTIDLGVKTEIDESTVSVIKLKRDMVEHDGLPIPSTTGDVLGLPERMGKVAVSANDTTAKLTFGKAGKAEKYVVKRDGEVVGEPITNSFVDTGLEPETEYTYVVTPVNSLGTGAPSAEVKATTTAEGVKEFKNFEPTKEALTAAEKGKGQLNEGGGQVTYSIKHGVVQFANALAGESYAVYFMEPTEHVKTMTISADKFPSNYEIFANAKIREQETGADELVQIHYKNAKPQSNFTLTQSATEPTSLSIVFDLFPDNKQELAEIKVVQ